jgi:tetratricopeptide (TPR) repeat protein
VGVVAEKQQKFEDATEWYKKELAIRLKLDDELDVAYAYCRLGGIAEKQQKHKVAEEWYNKALKISGQIENQTLSDEIKQSIARLKKGYR